MDLASILFQIDAEIGKLHRIREIVQELAGSRVHVPKPRRLRLAVAVPPVSVPAPKLVIIAPKQKREYRPRLRSAPITPRALGPAPSEKPVFVPRANVATRVAQDRTLARVDSLETLVRQNLLGGVA